MENLNGWLRAEIAQWLREGLITDEQAQRLYNRYPLLVDRSARSAQPWGKILFSAIGVGIFGLGIILLFAYNWDGMHRYSKLAAIGLGLLTAHGSAIFLQYRRRHPRLVDSLHLLGTMIFGAGIWLVAQIYHIDAHFPNGFLLWALAALAMAWAQPSVAQGILAALLLVLWSALEVLEFERFHPWSSWALLLAILPLAYWQRSLALLAMGILLLPLSYALSTLRLSGELAVVSLWWIAASYLALGRLAAVSAFPQSQTLLRGVGWLWLLPMLFLGSFADISEKALQVNLQAPFSAFYYGLPLLVWLSAWTLVFWRAPCRPQGIGPWLETAMILLAVVVVTLMSIGVDMPGFARVLANVLFLGFSLLFVWRGTEAVRWKLTSLACVMLAALVFARFNDLFDSLLARSAVFLLLGAALFLVGRRYSRQSERRKIARAPHV